MIYIMACLAYRKMTFCRCAPPIPEGRILLPFVRGHPPRQRRQPVGAERPAAARVGDRADPQRQQGTAAQHADAVRRHGPGPGGEAAGIALRALAQRGLELPLGSSSRTAPGRFLPTGIRCQRLEDYPGPLLLADAGLRRPGVHQFHLPFQERPASRDERAAEGLHRLREPRSRGQLPARFRGARRSGPDAGFFITFDGVDSNLFLWINGQRVGYSTNSRAPGRVRPHASTCSRAKTSSPPRCTAFARAATWKTRTCGG